MVCDEGNCTLPACKPQCDGKQCGPDGCEGSCGECPSDAVCDVASGQCLCQTESDQRFCERLQKDCGPVTAPDNCGVARTVNCGTCGDAFVCIDHVCTCRPEPDSSFCARLGQECDTLTGKDNCNADRTVTCGPCQSFEQCESGQCELCPGETDAEFCTRLQKTCGTLVGVDSCGEPKTAECGTCQGQGEVCGLDNLCTVPNANEDCTSAKKIVLDATGKATLTGDYTLTRDDSESDNCTGTGTDLVYELELTETRDLKLTLQATPRTGSYTYQIISVRTDCTSNATELGCNSVKQTDGQPASPSVLELHNLRPGTYFIWADTNSTSSSGAYNKGPFQLEVETWLSAGFPVNDTCAGALPLQFVGDAATVQGDTSHAFHDLSGSCHLNDSPIAGGDVAYLLDLPADGTVTVTLTPDPSTPGYTPALYLLKDCNSTASGNEVACMRTTSPGNVAYVRKDLTAGPYYVVVDGHKGSFGAFTLEVVFQRAPPANDTCAGAEALVWSGDVATTTGETSFAADDYTGDASCSYSVRMGGGDVVYSFQLTETRLVVANVTRDPSTPIFYPAVYLRGANCDDQADQKVCSTGTSAKASVTALLPPGSYHLIVDGKMTSTSATGVPTAGKFALEVQSRPPPGNDNCSGAEDLVFSGGTATAFGTTVSMANDSTGSTSCMGSGADVVYRMTLANPSKVSMSLVRDSTGQASIQLRKDCASVATELGCVTLSPYEITYPVLDAGTYYVWVDSVSTSATSTVGNFELVVMAQAVSLLPNDTCPGTPITFDPATLTATVTGDSLGAINHDTGSCTKANGGDLVYSFTLDQDHSLTAEYTAAAGIAPSMYLRAGNCASPALADQTICSYSAASSAYPPVPVTNKFALPWLPANDEAGNPITYYLFVDASYSSNPEKAGGPFTLKLALAEAVNNDTCATEKEAHPGPGDALRLGHRRHLLRQGRLLGHQLLLGRQGRGLRHHARHGLPPADHRDPGRVGADLPPGDPRAQLVHHQQRPARGLRAGHRHRRATGHPGDPGLEPRPLRHLRGRLQQHRRRVPARRPGLGSQRPAGQRHLRDARGPDLRRQRRGPDRRHDPVGGP
ncbi:MAG: hypothetical protein QM765_33890 [Myxococcales bacterium]